MEMESPRKFPGDLRSCGWLMAEPGFKPWQTDSGTPALSHCAQHSVAKRYHRLFSLILYDGLLDQLPLSLSLSLVIKKAAVNILLLVSACTHLILPAGFICRSGILELKDMNILRLIHVAKPTEMLN